MIPGDGTVIEGIASVDESAITGESAPVIRESGGDRSAVTGGTRVLSDRIVVEITQEPGQSFLDRMIALVEGAERRKTPNEIALGILLAGLTLDLPGRRRRRCGRSREFAGTDDLDDDADRAARRADPDHDRRAAVARSASPAWTGSCAATCSRSPARGRGLRRRRRAAARQDRHDHARQPPGRRVHPDARRRGGRAGRGGADVLAGRRDARGPLDRRARQAVRASASTSSAPHERALRPVHRADADERRRLQRHPPAQGRRRRDRSLGRASEGGQAPPRAAQASSTGSRREGGTPLAVARDSAGARRRLPQGHRQGGHERPLRPAARDGHPHGHGHRRQPADRGEDRRGGRRRRLPRRGHARAQARADPRAAGRRPAGRDDRRRHQRRARRWPRPTSAWR